jgi:hypothetical protein
MLTSDSFYAVAFMAFTLSQAGRPLDAQRGRRQVRFLISRQLLWNSGETEANHDMHS